MRAAWLRRFSWSLTEQELRELATDVQTVASPVFFLVWERLQKFGSHLACWKSLPGSSRCWVPVLLIPVRESVRVSLLGYPTDAWVA